MLLPDCTQHCIDMLRNGHYDTSHVCSFVFPFSFQIPFLLSLCQSVCLPLPFAFVSFALPFFRTSCPYRSIYVKATVSYSYNPNAGNHSTGRNVRRTHLEVFPVSLYVHVPLSDFVSSYMHSNSLRWPGHFIRL